MRIRIIFLGLLLSIGQVATQNAGLISPVEAVGSDHYSRYVLGRVIDGDTSGSSAGSFCTNDEEGRFVYLNLGGSYEISYVKVWGRHGTARILASFYLNQMQNLKITVADTVAALDDDASLCVYRDGSPAAGENRPETFTCSSTMTGQYVRVSMIDVSSGQFLCFNEMEVYGIADAGLISAVEAVGSDDYSSYVVGNVIDGDTSGNIAKSYCTRDEKGRFVYLNLNGSYEISYVKVWGRDGTHNFFLNQMENLKITVADTVDALDEDTSLCASRDGYPATGENRPETFTCSTTITGQYVKVSMIDVSSDQFLCFNEMEVYGIAATTTTTGGCPQLSKCERACKKKLGQRAFKSSRCGRNRQCFCVHKDNRVEAL